MRNFDLLFDLCKLGGSVIDNFFYKTALNKYPIKIIPTVVIPKNIASSCQRITFLRMIASGSESVTIAVMKASIVPRGAPFWTRASIIGITLIEFA